MAFDLQAGYGADAQAQAIRQMILDRLQQQHQALGDTLAQREMALREQEAQQKAQEFQQNLAERKAANDRALQAEKVTNFSKVASTLPMDQNVDPSIVKLGQDVGAGSQFYAPPAMGETETGQPFQQSANPSINLGTGPQQEEVARKAFFEKAASAPGVSPAMQGFLRMIPEADRTPGVLEAYAKLNEPQKPEPVTDANYMLGQKPIVAQRNKQGRLIYQGSDVTDQVTPYVPPREPKDTSARDAAALQQSYQFHATELDKAGQPLMDKQSKLTQAYDALAQHDPTSDSLVAPQILSFAAGGTGSGLRMNEAEIARIVGGRSAWQNLQAWAQHYATDPKNAGTLTPDQRTMMTKLLQTANDRLQQKVDAVTSARQALADSTDVNSHKQIAARLQKQLSDIDRAGLFAPASSPGSSPTGLPEVGGTFNGGKVLKVEKVQ